MGFALTSDKGQTPASRRVKQQLDEVPLYNSDDEDSPPPKPSPAIFGVDPGAALNL